MVSDFVVRKYCYAMVMLMLCLGKVTYLFKNIIGCNAHCESYIVVTMITKEYVVYSNYPGNC
jgi:hypothetical protein